MPRKTGKLSANKTFLIVVEGATENIYFNDVRAKGHIAGVTINPKQSKHSDVGTVLKTALDKQKSEVFDSIWCVFDRDTIANGISSKLENQYREALKKGIHFADSFPAFEVWFLLHYGMPKQFYNSQDDAIEDLRKHIPDYTKNQEWLTSASLYSKLKPYFDKAMENAAKLDMRSSITANPKSTITHVHKLFEELIGLARKPF